MANRVNRITLPPFWRDYAGGWVIHACGISGPSRSWIEEWDRFDFAIAALSKEVIQLCFAPVAHPDKDEPYTRLKENLLQQHSRMKYQRIERLHAVGGLGSRRPSQLLAEMMELCPDEEEASCFFVFLFFSASPCLVEGPAGGG